MNILRQGLSVLFAVGLATLWTTAESSAGGKTDYSYRVTFRPDRPTLGENYVMMIQVWNADEKYPMHFKAAILKLPEGDRLLSARSLEQRLPPGGTHIFRFDVYCGTEKGAISYDLSAAWE